MHKEIIIKDKKTWDEVIEGFPFKDIYFTYNYFVPFQKNGDGEPVLYYFECEHGKVAYPFMLRDVAKSKSFKGELKENTYFDISSAYGYGGPLYETNIKEGNIRELKNEFFKTFSAYCNKENIISQFDRFYPLITNYTFFEGYSEVLPIRKTVYMDLKDKEKIWSNLDSKCRNMIRKAKKNGISIVLVDDSRTIEDFKNIYNSTMENRHAEEYYYFNHNFFNDTLNILGESVFITNAYYEDKIIASSLIMRHGKHLHYHFSGTLKEYRRLPANNFLLYEVAKWGHENGYEKFHLGGGYESEGDSLYKFKKSFSKLADNDFYIGKKVHNVELYMNLADFINKDKQDGVAFFPAYRA